MNSKRFRELLSGLGHPSEADLLLYFDGELAERGSRKIQKHLRTCWPCRLELHKIEGAITEFMECRNAGVEMAPPPQGWSRFDGLLRFAVIEEEQKRRPSLGIFHGLPYLKIAVGVALAVMFVLWVYRNPIQTVSANTLIAKTEIAENQIAHDVNEPVVHRRITVRRWPSPRQPGQAGEVESWTDLRLARSRQRSTAELWPELEQVLNHNHMGGHRLLSAASFHAWRDSLARRHEGVASGRLVDGSESLTLNTATDDAPQPDSIVESSLVVRAADWRPVQQRLRVQGVSGIREYELTEIAYEVVPRSSLDAAVFDSPEQSRPASGVPEPALALPAPLETAHPPIETVIQALYALHRAHACLGENVEVLRDATGTVIVQGVVGTAERKEQIQAALEPVRDLVVRIKTIEEAQSASVPAAPARVVEPPEARSAAESRRSPIQEALKDRVSADRIGELAYRAVSLSEDWAADAWALRNLAEAIPANEVVNLSGSGRAMLAGMVQDHAGRLQSQVSACRSEFRPYVADAPGAAPAEQGDLAWPGSALQVFSTAVKAADLTRALCAGSGQLSGHANEAVESLVAAYSKTQAGAERLQAGVTALLESHARATLAGNQKAK